MNKGLKILVIISVILIVAGSLLAFIGFGFGGFKSVQHGPDGFYVTDTIDVEWTRVDGSKEFTIVFSDNNTTADVSFSEKDGMWINLENSDENSEENMSDELD